MDRRMIGVMFLMLALVFGYQMFMSYMYKTHPDWRPKPEPANATQPAPDAAAPTTDAVEKQPTTTTTQGPAVIAPPATTSTYRARGGLGTPVTLAPDDSDTRFPIKLALSPRRAAIESVVLKEYRNKLDLIKKGSTPSPYTFQNPYPQADDDAMRQSLATRSVIVDGSSVDIANVDWALDASDNQSAKYRLDIIDNHEAVVLSIFKTYTLQAKKEGSPGLEYEVAVTYEVVNKTARDIKAKLIFNGPTSSEGENNYDMPQIIVGYDDHGKVVTEHEAVGAETSKQLKHKSGFPLLWAGFTGAYFNAIVLPQKPKSGDALAVEKISQDMVNPKAEKKLHRSALTFQTEEIAIAPAGSASLPLQVFLGPKLRSILNSSYYQSFPRGYELSLVLTSGPCSACTYTWLVDTLVWLLAAFWHVGQDWGIAIILLVCVVRLLLHPITKRSQISMSKMSKMGPEMERIKKKFADQPEELKKAQAELIREQGITPILGCLPMFLQMPIWIALWQALQTSFELRQAPFLRFGGISFTWIKDLSQPDFLVSFGTTIDLPIIPTFSGINLLPILMGLVFWLQQKYQPKAAAMSKEQESQMKMMKWMTLLFPLMLYNGPAGLNLYILTSTTLGIWESKRVRDHIKQREEAEKAGRVFVEAPTSRAAKKLAKEEKREQPRKGGLAGWLADLQEKAERMRDESNKQNKRNK